MSAKVRELEIALMDSRSTFDRRVTQLTEELPGRLQRELKNLEGRDSHMWRESLSKQATMMETLTRLRESTKAKQSENNERFVSMSGAITNFE